MTKHAGTRGTCQDPSAGRRAALARLLREARENLEPVPDGRRRRTPGLRREEVADAAGISVTWYTWLEQGRDVTMSSETMARLARALRLDRTQERYLQSLARPREVRAPRRLSEAPVTLETLVDGLDPRPAYAVDRAYNVVAWNTAAARLLGTFGRGDPVRGNVLARLFLDADWQHLFVDWPEIARSAVGQFKASTVAFAQDADVTQLVSRLSAAAPAFRALWSAAELAASPDWTKRIRTGRGVERWRYSLLRPEGAARDFTVAIYMPG